MNEYKAPQHRKFTPSQEAQHREHEARIDYVAEHRDQFVSLLAAASVWPLQEVVDGVGFYAHLNGQSFDEAIYKRWLVSYHPHASGWDFKAHPIDFGACLSVMAAVSTGEKV